MTAASSRRIVITGMGMISPLGNGIEDLWSALAEGRSGIQRLESLPTTTLPVDFGGEARQFSGDINDFGELDKTQQRSIRKGLKVMCREIQMGVAAAQRALADAGLPLGKYDPDRTGVVYGSDYIMTVPEEFTEAMRHCQDGPGQFNFDRWAKEGLPRVTPLWLLKYLPNMPASHIAIYNDLRGPNNSITMREASSNLAIGEAYHTILRGHADTIVAGATGTRVHSLRTIHVVLQEELAQTNGRPPETASRPFDRDRNGVVVAEGAGALVLEELETARGRGATILAEVVGFGSSAAAKDGQPRADWSLANTLRQCLKASGWTPRQLGHIHAHGASTKRCDAAEAQAIRQVLGDDADRVPVTALKSFIGNAGAASGMLEAIASIQALHTGQLFPIRNYQTPDPECPILPVRKFGHPAGDCFISLNVSPQAQASGIAIRRWS